MCKVQPIPEELWGALSLITNELRDFLDNIDGYDVETMPSAWLRDKERLYAATELANEYVLCHSADGRVSQRGEIPQAWNSNTVFTPHRVVGDSEKCYNQLTFDWDFEPVEKMMMICPRCKGTKIEEEKIKGYRRYKCSVCDGAGEVKHPFLKEEENNE